MTEDAQILLLQKLDALACPTFDESWLPNEPSQAILTCIAMGPWKHDRRHKVKNKAIQWTGGRDLRWCDDCDAFPLNWQNATVNHLIAVLRARNVTFSTRIVDYSKTPHGDCLLFEDCGVGAKGTKTLWLFVRDYLGHPAFPIDRWVRRNLKAAGLPVDSWKMIGLCKKAGVDTNRLARAFYQGAFKEDKA